MNESLSFTFRELSAARRVLCVQPHYDDNDIGAGGTLARLHDANVEIIYLTVTNDLVGVVEFDLPDEVASKRLIAEQRAAGAIIGVDHQHWLGYPDAGDYDYFELRRQIIRFIRLYKPDFLFTCDPWLQYEAHRDHIQTGLAVAEASYLHAMRRLQVDPQIDGTYEPYAIRGVVFYFTQYPNITVDISRVNERKHQAIDCYRLQFSPQDLERLHLDIKSNDGIYTEDGFQIFVERLKVLNPYQLHIHPDSYRL